jgi:surface carbohydrate biosynthesis protein
MAYRVVIRAFTLRRDLGAAFLLKRFLEERGCSVIISSVRDFGRVVKYWAPHAVITNTKSTLSIAKQLAPDSLVIYWPGEGGGEDYQYSCAVRMKSDDYKLCDHLLVWGQKPKDFFTELHPNDADKVVVSGSPRLDTLKFCRDIIRPTDKSGSIGIVGKYTFINHHEGFATAPRLAKSGRHYEEVIRETVSLYQALRAIDHIVEKTDYNVSIRPYPSEDINSYEQILDRKGWRGRVEVDGTFLFSDWAARQEIIISETSTSFLESYILQIPTISLDRIIANESKGLAFDWGSDLSHDAALIPETFEELIALIERDDLPPPAFSEEVEGYLDAFHDWKSPRAANDYAAEHVVKRLNATKFPIRPHVPAPILRFIDLLSFKRIMYRNPLHANFNYCAGIHPEPGYFDAVVDRIRESARPSGDAPY